MHIPVLRKEVLEILNPQSNDNFIDATIGFGGHSQDILEKIKPSGKVLGIEWDKEVFEKLEKKERLVLINDSYINLGNIVRENNFKPVNGILFDLGFSSWHLEESGKGFSFLRNEFLDMRYNNILTKLTAEKIVNEWTEGEIKTVLKEYGEGDRHI